MQKKLIKIIISLLLFLITLIINFENKYINGAIYVIAYIIVGFEIIKKAIPKKARIDGPHPAKRTFQAIRIEVNNELGVITKMIDDAVSIMNEGGRVCIITFHSLEDRIVKNEFRDLALDCVCPSHLPICQCDKESLVKVITRKPILPSKEEIELNPRSRSAKLRVAERV